MRHKWSDEDLILAVKNNQSIASVIKELGLIPAGGNYQTINRKIKELHLTTEHMTGKRWNVGLLFNPSPPRPLKDILKANSPFQSDNLRKRLIREGYKEFRCESCRLTEWLDKPISLELEHVNGDHDDNRIENLKILCPNCHAQTPTYRGRNKDRGRVAQLVDAEDLKSLSKDNNLDARSNRVTPTCKCGKKINKRSKTCRGCMVRPTKINWPEQAELIRMIDESNYLAVSRKLGVSDNAIRKHLKNNSMTQ